MKKSLTWDEPSYISSGYNYLTQGEFRYNPSHPPLMQDLVALPLLFFDMRVPDQDFDYWSRKGNPPVLFGHEFLFRSGNDPVRVAFWSRLPVILLGTLLVWAVWAWGRDLYGSGAALVGTALVAFSPNLLAHSRLATEDLGCTAFVFLSVWMLWISVERPGYGTWLAWGAVTGLALLAKYTSLLLLPVYAIILVGLRLLGHPLVGSRRVFVALGVMAVVSAAVVGAGYNLSFDWSLYRYGLGSIYGDLTKGYLYYFAGSFSQEPRWYYAAAAFLMKTPLSSLLLVAAAAILAVADRERRLASLFLLVPALVVISASFFDQANLGIRRILPAYPFLFLLTSQIVARSQRRAVVAAAVVLVALSAAETIGIHPHYLSYFNAAVGGPKAGALFLDDSNIDWGQDLPALAAWQQANPDARPLRLAYFGTADPAAYGVEASPMTREEIAQPRPGYYAVSAHKLVWFRKLGFVSGMDLDWIGRYEPVARAGWSIYIFKFGGG